MVAGKTGCWFAERFGGCSLRVALGLVGVGFRVCFRVGLGSCGVGLRLI